MRERLMVNVANLRYELDVISILTPLPSERRPKLAVLAPTKAPDKMRRQSPLSSPSVPEPGAPERANVRKRRIDTKT
jgi:hypothetical protein